MKIKELVKNTQLNDLPLLVNKVVSGTTNQGSPYLSILFADNTATLSAKVWDAKANDVETCQSGTIVLVSGVVNLYQNALQLKVTNLKKTDQSLYDLSEFMMAAPLSIQQLQKAIEKAISDIENPIIKSVVGGMLDRYSDRFYKYPAATKNHHEFYSGIAMHVKA
ncbi:MAG: OB-fold nucleic acid binding domain-containing protein, partial [Erysipelotrichaceae bacterium]